MSEYRQTFRSHRRLLSAPIVLATVLALWTAVASPKSYESSASLWVDTGPGSLSSVANANPALPSPAEQEQSVVAELLRTRDFTLKVGHEGPLGKYLAAHSTRAFAPTSVLSLLRGPGRLEDRIISDLGGKHIVSTVAGPQVLQISYLGPTPTVAVGTLKTLLRELEQKSAMLAASRDRGAVAFYRSQVDGAQKAVADARDQVTTYRAGHPGAVDATDPMLRALRQAQGQATARLARATTNLHLASGAVKSPTTDLSTVEVLDAPAMPVGPASGKKKAVLAVIGGLFAGALISALGVLALTPGKPEATTPEFGAPTNGFSAATHAAALPPLRTAEDVDDRVGESESEPSREVRRAARERGRPRQRQNGGGKPNGAKPPPVEVPSAADE